MLCAFVLQKQRALLGPELLQISVRDMEGKRLNWSFTVNANNNTMKSLEQLINDSNFTKQTIEKKYI